jgi:hypothetical protein
VVIGLETDSLRAMLGLLISPVWLGCCVHIL